ncbi:MAG: CRISPR-associated endoribonuclease Cas2 [candidate division WS6 bacterium OLB20]|uniref:CRISPR-associated endoribonuclease Cas2 n=1 Tax=candidate division WS6 bacterium OLB20 TaxID=1617426 RepID=A0A136LXM7_9BACT|nr:MAG: CRISPR-associated endoribonuclease Cas2 [candidate division WS6 bacterium OLB20]
MHNKFMRILVLFDLPVSDKDARRAYSRFHKFLEKDGYDMLQFSVYCRLCNGLDGVKKAYAATRV